VTSIDISRNSIGPVGAKSVASLISGPHGYVPLTSLDISENQIRAEGCLELARALSECRPHLAPSTTIQRERYKRRE
jgi:hypothetical protein